MLEVLIVLCMSSGLCEVEVVESLEWHVANPPPPVVQAPPPRPRVVQVNAGVGQWRPLVQSYFGSETDRALCVMWHESRGDPTAYNPSSGASGLMQHLPKYWAERTEKAGWVGADIFDPEANVAVAAWLQRVGGWRHWSPWLRGECR